MKDDIITDQVPPPRKPRHRTALLISLLGVLLIVAALLVSVGKCNRPSQAGYVSTITAEGNNFANSVVECFNASADQHGAGREITRLTVPLLSAWLGWTEGKYSSDVADYRLSLEGGKVLITAIGRQGEPGAYSHVVTTVNLPQGSIETREE